MIPNLYVAAHNLVTPRSWFSSKDDQSQRSSSVVIPNQPLAASEHWNSPIPGVYRHEPGRGWFLIQLDSDPSKPEKPDRVIFCAPLNRGILKSDYNARSIRAKLPKGCTPAQSRSSSPSSRRSKRPGTANSRHSSVDDTERREVSFVRHDDGVTWLNDKDADGNDTKGPWQRFCLDKQTGEMRVMLKGDDPAWRDKSNKSSSRPGSDKSRPTSLKSGDSKSFASSIRAMAPELDGQPQTPSFLGPRSLNGSAKTSPRSSPSVSRRGSIKGLSDKGTRKSPLNSPGLPSEA